MKPVSAKTTEGLNIGSVLIAADNTLPIFSPAVVFADTGFIL